ncbi:diflavin flavoprotein [Leptolyngbya sp. FACHB-261]|uniref:diflavin flavoprotein n=1 Tax=Leptolyngbya sp. FACHB-261 TaxID=2692806 RepID=UPI00168A0D20|nr:diflavin flavoprotein [Leptolyngbya sp. FACHB-261]MBD2101068.1 flavin reductase [Leptolyngbya sp. FACHB-261]
MVMLTDKKSLKTVQVAEIGVATTAFRSQDWDRERFDIEYALEHGTTYNAFLIKGEKVALIDTSHEKFREPFLASLHEQIDPAQIDYIIASHTEPDHSGLIGTLLELAPNATVVCSKIAGQFLENMIHRPFKLQVVKGGDKLDLGNGHCLEFIMAPNLHWPDTIFTYDPASEILYTCDAFGAHYCSERLADDDLAEFETDLRYYYDCLMGPNARSVLTALKRMEPLSISMLATGHGPLIRNNVVEVTRRYRDWSQKQDQATTTVAVFYIADYGHSASLAQAIAHGISKAGVATEMINLGSTDDHEIQAVLSRVAGFVLSTPPAMGEGPNLAYQALGSILAAGNKKQLAGLFESCGGQDESITLIANQLKDAGFIQAFEPIRIETEPSNATLQVLEEAGTDLAQVLSRDKLIQQSKSLSHDLDKAVGRLAGGLYLITARRAGVSSAMIASWVSQASFEPLGVSIAVAKDRAIESLMQVNDRFVLNVLEEGNYLPLMRHFLRRFAPGEDRFAGVKTYEAANGSPILAEALAYLECQVQSRMETADHWIVYAVVESGKVSHPEGLTATHHRKVGNHY